MTRTIDGLAPLIVRVAGLPASAVTPFTSDLCDGRLAPILALELELRSARSRLVDLLYAEIKQASPSTRRWLIELKRDCYNGRSFGRRLDDPRWDELPGSVASSAGEVIGLEEKLAVLAAEFDRAYEREREREHQELLALLGDRRLHRGITLASPELAANASRLRKDVREHGRKEKKAALSLARYVTRAALKLSPFSTLTRLAIGLVEEGGGYGLRLLGDCWEERSLLRLKRYILDQCASILTSYPPFRDRLTVRLNDTIERLESGHSRFLRPSLIMVDTTHWRLRQLPASLVKAKLSGPLIDWLIARLDGSTCAYGHLLSEAAAAFTEPEGSAGVGSPLHTTFDRLIEIGFLLLEPTWSTSEFRLEERMLELLRSLPPSSALAELVAGLDRIVEIEQHWTELEDHTAAVAEIDRCIDITWHTSTRLGGYEQPVTGFKGHGNLYEDAMIRAPGRGHGGWSEVLRLTVGDARAALESVDPLVRIAALFSFRNDILLSLAALAAERNPGCEVIGLLDLFALGQDLWNEFSAFDEASRIPATGKLSFNPFSLKQIDEIDQLRRQILEALPGCTEHRGEESEILGYRIAGLLADVPPNYHPAVGPCLFIQPVSPTADLWVMNRMFEGTGRYGSRFTTVMAEDIRARYVDRLLSCSSLDLWGEQYDLLDLAYTRGNTINVHAFQTPKVLEIPGERLDLPENRRLRLGDLKVLLRTADGLPVLVDPSGRRLLPVHLSTLNNSYMPALLKFVSWFGPGEFRPGIPPSRRWSEGDVTLEARLRIGCVAIRRRRWIISPVGLAAELELCTSEAGAFEIVNRWRLARSIPDRVFLIEKVHEDAKRPYFKPQFIDFRSPLLNAVFRSALKLNSDCLTLEEVLPLPEDALTDDAGCPWLVELQLDSIVLQRGTGTCPSFAERSEEVALSWRSGVCNEPMRLERRS